MQRVKELGNLSPHAAAFAFGALLSRTANGDERLLIDLLDAVLKGARQKEETPLQAM